MTSTVPPASAAQIAALFADLPVEDETGTAWKQEGLCSQTDPDLFFPEQGDSAVVPKRICKRCPVRQLCLQYALDHREPHGVWGGITAHERRHMLSTTRGRRIAA